MQQSTFSVRRFVLASVLSVAMSCGFLLYSLSRPPYARANPAVIAAGAAALGVDTSVYVGAFSSFLCATTGISLAKVVHADSDDYATWSDGQRTQAGGLLTSYFAHEAGWSAADDEALQVEGMLEGLNIDFSRLGNGNGNKNPNNNGKKSPSMIALAGMLAAASAGGGIGSSLIDNVFDWLEREKDKADSPLNSVVKAVYPSLHVTASDGSDFEYRVGVVDDSASSAAGVPRSLVPDGYIWLAYWDNSYSGTKYPIAHYIYCEPDYLQYCVMVDSEIRFGYDAAARAWISDKASHFCDITLQSVNNSMWSSSYINNFSCNRGNYGNNWISPVLAHQVDSSYSGGTGGIGSEYLASGLPDNLSNALQNYVAAPEETRFEVKRSLDDVSYSEPDGTTKTKTRRIVSPYYFGDTDNYTDVKRNPSVNTMDYSSVVTETDKTSSTETKPGSGTKPDSGSSTSPSADTLAYLGEPANWLVFPLTIPGDLLDLLNFVSKDGSAPVLHFQVITPEWAQSGNYSNPSLGLTVSTATARNISDVYIDFAAFTLVRDVFRILMMVLWVLGLCWVSVKLTGNKDNAPVGGGD